MQRNVETKAWCTDLVAVESRLARAGAVLTERLSQTDTYFKVAAGRLKLRTFEAESADGERSLGCELIRYQRPDIESARISEYERTRIEDAATCLDALASQHGIRCIVTKQRLVWCLDATRIHLDRLEGMGTFIELETIVNDGDETGARTEHDRIANIAEIAQVDVVGCSYCDLLPGDAELHRHPSLADRFDPAVRIVAYELDWPGEFEREARAIRDALGGLATRVDHIGSTAVPGLAAKPVIDIQVSVDELEPRDAYVDALLRLGYLFAPDPASPGYRFFGKPAARPRRYHVHVCEAGSAHEERHLAVRGFLRARPDEAERYEALKRELVARHPGDRLAYIEGKKPFMAGLERRALSEMPGFRRASRMTKPA